VKAEESSKKRKVNFEDDGAQDVEVMEQHSLISRFSIIQSPEGEYIAVQRANGHDTLNRKSNNSSIRHHVRASSCRVQVANLTWLVAGQLLMLNTDSIFSNHRVSPTTPSVPLKSKVTVVVVGAFGAGVTGVTGVTRVDLVALFGAMFLNHKKIQ
ncbi:hypothetical protein Tco_0081442, partial [Tanacetum coccineum]